MAWISTSSNEDGFGYSLPEIGGVYVIYFNNNKNPDYIGSTNNLRRRLLSHCINKYERYSNSIRTVFGVVTKVTVKYKSCPGKYCSWLDLEYNLIIRLNPTFNKKGKKNG